MPMMPNDPAQAMPMGGTKKPRPKPGRGGMGPTGGFMPPMRDRMPNPDRVTTQIQDGLKNQLGAAKPMPAKITKPGQGGMGPTGGFMPPSGSVKHGRPMNPGTMKPGGPMNPGSSAGGIAPLPYKPTGGFIPKKKMPPRIGTPTPGSGVVGPIGL